MARRNIARRAVASMLALAAIVGRCPSAWASPAQDYVLHCMGCHGATAEGVPGKVPPLAGSLVQFMRTAAGRSYVLRVPGASNSILTDAQLAEVLNWIAMRFGGDKRDAPAASALAPVTMFTAREVSAQRRLPMAAVQATRRAVVRELAASGTASSDNY